MAQPTRVLLVDDEEAIRRRLCVSLVQHGYEVDTCSVGLAALVEIRAAQQRGAPFHTVILDVNLPDIDGLELLRTIRASYPDTPVLLISGYRSEGMLRTATLGPKASYLRKPFFPEELLRSLEALAPTTAPPEQPVPSHREQPVLHATAHALFTLPDGVQAQAFAQRLHGLEGLCYALPVRGHWDVVALLQGMDRGSIERRLESWLSEAPPVEELELLHARLPLVGPELWPVLVDRAGAPGGLGAPPDDDASEPAGDAFVVMEVDPEHLVETYVRVSLRDDVVQADASRDRSTLVLYMRDWTGDGHLLRVPDSLRLLPGVLRARALPVRPLHDEGAAP